MQHSYILSNKQNETYQDRSPLKLKSNYQVRQRYHERSKSPLVQTSSNRRINFVDSKENIKPQMTSKRRDLGFKYTDDSTVKPYSKMINQNISPSNNHQSTFDLSKIKPISLESNKLGQNGYTRNYEPNNADDKTQRSEYRTFSKSAHRQNSKHLGFVAKVDNIQKLNNQISSLLSYVKDSKSAQRDDHILQEHSNHKPRYGLISETSKSYQRRLNVLQKPKGPEPLISAFTADNEQNHQILQNKSSNKKFKYQYNGYGLLDKSPYRIQDRKNDIETSKSPIRKDLSPKNSGNRFNQVKNPSISPLKTVKSQLFNRLLTPSQSQQKLSKLTSVNNPDLQFYYESLKKRDQQIEIFKKKVENSIENQPPKQNYQHYSQLNQSNLLHDESNLLNIRSNHANQYDRNNNNSDKNISNHPNQPFQRDPFVTQQEIQVYKDINRLHNPSNNGRLSAVKRIQRLKAQVNQSGSYDRQNILLNKTGKKQYVYDRRTNQSTTNNFIDMKIERLDKVQQPINNKIQEQIRKIQNQLKDCKKEKSYLRQKYGSLLTKQKSKKIGDASQFVNLQTYQQTQIFNKYSDTIQSNYDKERMFDSSDKHINRHLVNLNNQTEQDFHKDLRKRMISQNQRIKRTQYLNNDSHEINMQTSKYEKPLTADNGKRQKKFEIQLQKVQITKPQTTRLGTIIAQKIEIDLKLRELRQKFTRNKNPNKWDNLRLYLAGHYGINRSSKQLQQLLSISPEEHNPFSPTHMSSKSMKNGFNQQLDSSNDQSDQQQIPLLCSLLSESLTYFQSNLLHKFSQKKLKKQHFSFRELDLSAKGHLSLEDLICFVNLHAGKFYRNRDIIFLLKSIMLFHKNMKDLQNNNLSKNSNEYKFSYDFLWTILTDST